MNIELININEGESAFFFVHKMLGFFFQKKERRWPVLQVLLCVAVAAFQVSHQLCLD